MNNNFYHKMQSAMLVTSLAVLLGVVGWMLGGHLFALSAMATMILLYFFTPRMSPFLILKWLRGRALSYHDAPRLYEVLETLAKRAELPRMPILYYFPAEVMNAFTLGTREDAAIAVSEGLLQRLNRSEIKAVLAHEGIHIRSNDMRIIGFADLASRLTHGLSLFGQLLLIINLPLVLFGEVNFSWIAILLLIFAPSISALLQLALSRTREYTADLGAVELMGNPESLATSLAKIEKHGRSLIRYLPWTANPQSQILRTHPPTKERIRRLMEIQDREPEPAWSFFPGYEYKQVRPLRVSSRPRYWPQRYLNRLWY
ncbi:MAG: M48 family metalloprotease [Deltaproteobacteria bacterium]|nr:MAG: M48 family metalloprotease [Deltaproteobacteria bacterium]